MRPYADTNFIVRWYLPMAESVDADDQMGALRNNGTPALPLTWLHRIEVTNAFQMSVFQSRLSARQPRHTLEQAMAAFATFRADAAAGMFLQSVPLPEKLEAQFEELSLRHTARHGFRTYDLLHVSSALLLKCDTFWSFDPKASKLAALEGLKVRL